MIKIFYKLFFNDIEFSKKQVKIYVGNLQNNCKVVSNL